MDSPPYKGMIIALSAPSGTGKTTVATKVLRKIPGIVRSVSLNTRPPRPLEIHGVDYIFVSEDEFDDNIKKGNLIEFVEIYGFRRGTPKDTLLESRERGLDTLCIIEWTGMKHLKEHFGPSVVSIFLLPPSLEKLRLRLITRAQDSNEEIERRLALAQEEMTNAADYDHVVLNDDLNVCVRKVVKIIKNERKRC
ncbi:guanylate kinase [Alphaproteobacteria bacterium]|nr:guanylate kinase [Alphaproteobacteria bacterium]